MPRRRPRLRAALLVLPGLVAALLSAPAPAEFAPVTDPAFQVTPARPVFDNRTQRYLLDVRVTHNGASPAPGEYRLVVASANKTALDTDGTTAAGESFVALITGPGAAFAPATSLDRRLVFTGGRGQLVATLRLERALPAPPPNQPPVAAAGPDQTLTLASGESTVLVTLDGSASGDPDGSIAGYAWTGSP